MVNPVLGAVGVDKREEMITATSPGVTPQLGEEHTAGCE